MGSIYLCPIFGALNSIATRYRIGGSVRASESNENLLDLPAIIMKEMDTMARQERGVFKRNVREK